MNHHSLQVFPYIVQADGTWSLSDAVMAGIWFQLEAERKVEHLFYDGQVRDLTGWLAHIKKPGLHLVIVADVEKQIPVHVAWLTDLHNVTAWAHHCSIGKYTRGAWEVVRDYWRRADFLRILLGLTPETNVRAVKFLEKICGFTILGTIPEICNMAYVGRRVPGVVSYFELHKQEIEQWASAERAAERAVVAVA